MDVSLPRHVRFGMGDDATTTFSHANRYQRERLSGGVERLIIGPADSHTALVSALMDCLPEPFRILYVLVVPRVDGVAAARYESPSNVSRQEVQEFLWEFSEFLECDGRHHLWIANPEQGTIVHDRHDLIYAYGPLECFTRTAVILRRLAPATVMLVTCSAVAALQEQRGTDPSMDLARFVDGERLAHQLPGLAAVIVRSDGPPRVYVGGERRIGRGDLITPADRMHLGSLTKAITATLVGALAEKRLMTLETTIGQTFPELSAKIQPAYRNVSVRQLLAHAGGIPPYRTRESLRWLLTLNGTPSEQRYALVERVLTETPRFEPGTRHEYSNAGGATAGAMAERIGGSPYRQLVQELVFARLGGHAAFGNPGLAAEPQPWGHIRTILGTATEVTPANAVYTTPLAIEPAGDASPSMQDYGRFLQLHVRGLRGRDDVLKATTIQDLHRRVAPNNPALGSVMGWAVMTRDGVESHEHVGSYGAYVAYATVQPSRDIAIAVFTNIGGGQDLRDVVARVAMRIATRVATAGAVSPPLVPARGGSVARTPAIEW